MLVGGTVDVNQSGLDMFKKDSYYSPIPKENNSIAAMLKAIELFPNFICFVGVR